MTFLTASIILNAQRSSQLLHPGSDEAIIRALILRTIKEATKEVAAEAEEEISQIESLAAQRQSLYDKGEASVIASIIFLPLKKKVNVIGI